MTRSSEQAFSKESFLAAAEKLLAKRRGKPALDALRPFLEQYLADAFVEDVASLTVEDAASLALDLWEYDQENQSRPGSRAIRTRRPAGAGGKPLRITVAEVAGDDMAFLVDSAIAAYQ